MAFDLVGRLQLLPPSNASQLLSQIQGQLKGLKVEIDVGVSPRAQQTLKSLRQEVNSINSSLSQVKGNASSATTGINSFNSATQQGVRSSNNFSQGVNRARVEMDRFRGEVEAGGTALENFSRQSGLAARRFIAFSVAAGAILRIFSGIRDGITEAVKFERELVKIAQLGENTRGEIRELSNEVTRLATNLGVSSSELIVASRVLRQAGLSVKDTKEALDALAQTTLAPNFGELTDTLNGAIAAMRQFNIPASELLDTLGSINAVAGKFAVEAEDITQAIQRSGGAFSSLGGNLNELISIFTSVRATTRESAETISTGLRTIFTRLQRTQTIDALNDLGINLRRTREEATLLGNTNLAGQFVGGYEAIRRISQGLADIPSADPRFSRIIEQIGGFRQISTVIPLLRQFGLAQEALNVAQLGGVSLTNSTATAQDALIVRLTKLRESFSALFRDITNDRGFQTLISTFVKFAEVTVTVIDALKPLIPLLAALSIGKALRGLSNLGAFSQTFFAGPQIRAGRPAQTFNRGGPVGGFGNGDSVPAMLQPGEFVLRKDVAEGIGHQNLLRLQTGGLVQGNKRVGQITTKPYSTKSTGVSGNKFPSVISFITERLPDNLKAASPLVASDLKFNTPYETHYLDQGQISKNFNDVTQNAVKLVESQVKERFGQAKFNEKELTRRFSPFILEGVISGLSTASIAGGNNPLDFIFKNNQANKLSEFVLPTPINLDAADAKIRPSSANSIIEKAVRASFKKGTEFDAFTSNPKLSSKNLANIANEKFKSGDLEELKKRNKEIATATASRNALFAKKASGGFITQDEIRKTIDEFSKLHGVDYNKAFTDIRVGGKDSFRKFGAPPSSYAGFVYPTGNIILNKDTLTPETYKGSLLHELTHGVDRLGLLTSKENQNVYNYLSQSGANPFVKQQDLVKKLTQELLFSGTINTEDFRYIRKPQETIAFANQLLTTNTGTLSNSVRTAITGGNTEVSKLISRGKSLQVEELLPELRKITQSGDLLKLLSKSKLGFQGQIINDKIEETFGPPIVRRAMGGSSTDTVPALLTPGEFVFSRDKVQQIGINNLRAANTSGNPAFLGFAKGGLVPGFADGDVVGGSSFSLLKFRRELETELSKSLSGSSIARIIAIQLQNIFTQAAVILGKSVSPVQLEKTIKGGGLQITSIGQRGNLSLGAIPGQGISINEQVINERIVARRVQQAQESARAQAALIADFGIQGRGTIQQEREREFLEAERLRQANVANIGLVGRRNSRFIERGGPITTAERPNQVLPQSIFGTQAILSQTPRELAGNQLAQQGLESLSIRERDALIKAHSINIGNQNKLTLEAIATERKNIQQLNKRLTAEQAHLLAIERLTTSEKLVTDSNNRFLATSQTAAQFQQIGQNLPGARSTSRLGQIGDFITGRGLSDATRSRLQLGALTAVSVLPFLQQAFSQTITPEAAVQAGTQGQFQRNETIAGGLSGATLGAGFGATFGIPGIAIGAVVGGLLGVADASRKAAIEISKAEIGLKLTQLGTVVEDLLLRFQQGRGVDVGLRTQTANIINTSFQDINRLSAQQARGFFGFNGTTFEAERTRNLREQIGPQLPNLQRLISAQITDVVRRNPNLTPQQAVSQVLSTEDNQRIVSVISQVRNVSQSFIQSQLTLQATNDRFQVQLVNSTAALQSLNNVLSVSITNLRGLSTSIESSFNAINSSVDIVSRGQIGGLQVPRLQDILGSPEFIQQAQRATSISPQGQNELLSVANALNTLTTTAAPLLRTALETSSTPETIASTLEEALRRQLSGNITPQVENQIRALVSVAQTRFQDEPTRKAALINPQGEFQNLVRASGLDQVIQVLESSLQEQIRTQNAFNAQFNRIVQTRLAAEQLLLRVSLSSAQTRRTGLEFSLGNQGRGAELFRFLSLQSELAPFQQNRQNLLNRAFGTTQNLPNQTGIGRLIQGGTATQIGEALNRVESQITFLSNRSQTIGGEELNDVNQRLRELTQQSTDLRSALQGLTDSSREVSIIQERLGVINREEEARRRVGQNLLTSSAGDLIRLQRGLGLALQARQAGTNLFSLPLFQRRQIFDALQQFQGVRLPGGDTAETVRNQLLGQSGIGLSPAQQNERQDLQNQILERLNEATLASRELARSQTGQADRLNDVLQRQNKNFLDRLQQIFLEQQRIPIQNQLTAAQSQVSNIQTAQIAVQAASSFGLFSQGQRLTPQNIEFLRTPPGQQGLTQLQNIIDSFQSFRDVQLNPVANNLNSIFSIQSPLIRQALPSGLPQQLVNPITSQSGLIFSRTFQLAEQAGISRDNLSNLSGNPGLQNQVQGLLQQAIRERINELLSNPTIVGQIINTRTLPNQQTLQNIGIGNAQNLSNLLANQPQNFNNRLNALVGWINEIPQSITSLTNLQGSLQTATQQVNNFSTTLSSLNKVGTTREFTGIKKASGGPISGSGAGDSVPALLSPGEFVVNRDATRSNFNLLQRINAQRFAVGGLVGNNENDRFAKNAFISSLRNDGEVLSSIPTELRFALSTEERSINNILGKRILLGVRNIPSELLASAYVGTYSTGTSSPQLFYSNLRGVQQLSGQISAPTLASGNTGRVLQSLSTNVSNVSAGALLSNLSSAAIGNGNISLPSSVTTGILSNFTSADGQLFQVVRDALFTNVGNGVLTGPNVYNNIVNRLNNLSQINRFIGLSRLATLPINNLPGENNEQYFSRIGTINNALSNAGLGGFNQQQKDRLNSQEIFNYLIQTGSLNPQGAISTVLAAVRNNITLEQAQQQLQGLAQQAINSQREAATRQGAFAGLAVNAAAASNLINIGQQSRFFGTSGFSGGGADILESQFSLRNQNLLDIGRHSGLFGGVGRFAEGGIVTGPGNTDSVPALLTPGELVLNRAQVQKFQDGGLVGGATRNITQQNTFNPTDFTSAINNFSNSTSQFITNVSSFNQSINTFASASNSLAQAFNQLPDSIQLSGNFRHEVIVNGVEVLTSILPEIAKMVDAKIQKALGIFVQENLPDIGPLNPYDTI